ncbi:MAG: HAMP domain-containing protein [Hyphomicrobiaceae bacterium]|nr:HAMP domain-containing protein [Hyphomicrobiaceae bacterium]
MTLRLKLILSIALCALASFALGAATIYVQASHKVETEMSAALAAGTRIALKAEAEAEMAGGPDAARQRLAQLVAGFDGHRHLRAYLVDASGGRLAASTVAEPAERAPAWFYALLKGNFPLVNVPLPNSFQAAGSILLEADSRNEVGEAWADALRASSILALMLSLVLVIVYVLIGAALHPLEQLARAFGEIANDDRPMPVPERGPSELAHVYQSFNRMLGRLNETEAANRRLTEQLLTVQEEERADIARDMHDEIGPLLFAVDVDAASVERLASSGQHGQIVGKVTAIREAVAELRRHVRGILSRLRPAALLDLGLSHALDNLVASWRGRHPEIDFSLACGPVEIPPETEAVIYRVAQEAISNSVRHGRPDRISVNVALHNGGIGIKISDDGRGLSSPGEHASTSWPALSGKLDGGLGLLGMRERVAQHGGTLEIVDLAPGPGVAVAAWLPLKDGLNSTGALTNETNIVELINRI